MLQDLGHALGALLPSALNLLNRGSAEGTSSGATLGAIAGLSVIAMLFYLQLDVTGLPPRRREPHRISARSRGILARICALFAVDALAGTVVASRSSSEPR
jgi:hypothetical protein